MSACISVYSQTFLIKGEKNDDIAPIKEPFKQYHKYKKHKYKEICNLKYKIAFRCIVLFVTESLYTVINDVFWF